MTYLENIDAARQLLREARTEIDRMWLLTPDSAYAERQELEVAGKKLTGLLRSGFLSDLHNSALRIFNLSWARGKETK